MSRIYYRGAMGAILCFDLTDRSSFNRLRFWIGELQLHEKVSTFWPSTIQQSVSMGSSLSDNRFAFSCVSTMCDVHVTHLYLHPD